MVKLERYTTASTCHFIWKICIKQIDLNAIRRVENCTALENLQVINSTKITFF